jgi:hypothetical protein
MAPGVTLLDLVTAVSDQARSEAEVIATVVYLVNSGTVRLCGTFKGARFDTGTMVPAGGLSGTSPWSGAARVISPLDIVALSRIRRK